MQQKSLPQNNFISTILSNDQVSYLRKSGVSPSVLSENEGTWIDDAISNIKSWGKKKGKEFANEITSGVAAKILPTKNANRLYIIRGYLKELKQLKKQLSDVEFQIIQHDRSHTPNTDSNENNETLQRNNAYLQIRQQMTKNEAHIFDEFRNILVYIENVPDIPGVLKSGRQNIDSVIRSSRREKDDFIQTILDDEDKPLKFSDISDNYGKWSGPVYKLLRDEDLDGILMHIFKENSASEETARENAQAWKKRMQNSFQHLNRLVNQLDDLQKENALPLSDAAQKRHEFVQKKTLLLNQIKEIEEKLQKAREHTKNPDAYKFFDTDDKGDQGKSTSTSDDECEKLGKQTNIAYQRLERMKTSQPHNRTGINNAEKEYKRLANQLKD